MSDLFRITSHSTEEQAKLMLEFEEKAYEFYRFIDQFHHCREKSLAVTKLEECVMWGVKAITVPKPESIPSDCAVFD